MMTEVIFVLLKKREMALHLCRLAEKYFTDGRPLLIHVADNEQAQKLDRYLWTYNRGSFLPHAVVQAGIDQASDGIVITTSEHNPNNAVVLIMAHPCSLPFMQSFEQVIDFAEVYDPALAQQSRERFRCYREHGFNPRMA